MRGRTFAILDQLFSHSIYCFLPFAYRCGLQSKDHAVDECIKFGRLKGKGPWTSPKKVRS
jgi:hypothetical protein